MYSLPFWEARSAFTDPRSALLWLLHGRLRRCYAFSEAKTMNHIVRDIARVGLLRPPLARSRLHPGIVRTFSKNAPQSSDVKSNPKIRVLDQKPDPALFEDHRKPWFFTLNKIGNFLVIPSAQCCSSGISCMVYSGIQSQLSSFMQFSFTIGGMIASTYLAR